MKNSKLKIGAYRRLFNKDLKDLIIKSEMTNSKLGKLCGIGATKISTIINFRYNPNEDLKIKIAIALNTTIDSIFPENYDNLYNQISPLPRKGELTVDILSLDCPEVKKLESPYGVDEMIEKSNNFYFNKKIKDVMYRVCRPREIKIIEYRFGLKNGDTHTLKECGMEFGVTQERIRNIEARALEMIRNNLIDESSF